MRIRDNGDAQATQAIIGVGDMLDVESVDVNAGRRVGKVAEFEVVEIRETEEAALVIMDPVGVDRTLYERLVFRQAKGK